MICLKALVVGYGSIGKRHIMNLLSLPNMEVVVCSKHAKLDSKLRKRCKVLDSLEKCIKEKPDIGFVTNYTSHHVETAIKLASAGIDLFIEKPLSDSSNNVSKLTNLVKKKKLVTLIGCNMRFDKCIRKIKEMISNNEIGRILSVHVECGTYLPYWHPYEDYRQSYASRKDLGGGVVLTCIHEIDYLYWFFGAPNEVFSVGGKYSDLEINVDDLSTSILKFKNNIIVELHLDYFQRPESRSCKIVGTKGTIYWDSQTNKILMYDIKKKKWIEKLQLKNYDRNAMYLDELSHFIKCVKRKEKSINDIDQGRKTLEMALAITRSSKTNKVIKL